MLDRGDYWQCAYVIPKGAARGDQGQGPRGIPRRHRRDSRRQCAIACRSSQSWDDVKLLTVKVDRLRAVASAGPAVHRRCGARDVAGRRRRDQSRDPGRGGGGQPAGRRRCAPARSATDDLAAVQRRRTFPTRATQRLQVQVQNNVLKPVLASRADAGAAVAGAADQSLSAAAAHSGAAGRLGFRPEHVRTPRSLTDGTMQTGTWRGLACHHRRPSLILRQGGKLPGPGHHHHRGLLFESVLASRNALP